MGRGYWFKGGEEGGWLVWLFEDEGDVWSAGFWETHNKRRTQEKKKNKNVDLLRGFNSLFNLRIFLDFLFKYLS